MAGSSPAQLRAALRSYALSLPETREDHPWGESVVKVGGKIVAFFGPDGATTPIVGMKLVQSHGVALAQPGVTPTRYNLGRSGWVTVTLSDETPYEMLREWIVESYRAVAPKRLARLIGPAD